MSTIAGVDPRTGTPLASVAESTTDDEVARLAEEAADAAGEFADRGRDFRADLLTRIADEVEQARAALVSTAARETGFADAKLDGELTRAAFQFRFFGDVVRDGGYLEATIDPAGDTPTGPRPDLRRILVPLGPVAVFGASNYPFAFSALGGDTASALAAGNPVIVKAHSSHPGTSQLSFDLMRRAVTAAGAPDATVGIVFGTAKSAAEFPSDKVFSDFIDRAAPPVDPVLPQVESVPDWQKRSDEFHARMLAEARAEIAAI